MMYMLERRVRLAFLHSVFAPGGKGIAANQEGIEGSSTARVCPEACSSAGALYTPHDGKASCNSVCELTSAAESSAVMKRGQLKV